MPDSPDMKHARNRLDHLLSGIRKGDDPSALMYREESNLQVIDVEEEETRRGPGRPRKVRKEKKVVFELRGKSFSIRDVEQPESIYSLCRKWMYGKDDEKLPPEEPPPPYKCNISLDLLATKPIYAMPPPNVYVQTSKIPLNLPEFHTRYPCDIVTPRDGEPIATIQQLWAEHMRHWKRVKKCHNEHSARRKERYRDSLTLLRTVYRLAQQMQ